MTSSIRRNAGLLTLLLSASVLSAPAAANDLVVEGYRKYYAGDRAGAQQTLEGIVARQPGDLPAQFGLLHILLKRMEEERGLLVEFEKKLDTFINAAEVRHDRSSQDAQALFYLANGYMMRAQFRINYDKGTWGAARDGAKARKLIDAYLRRHPEHGDAYFTLGLYNYYVDIAPAFVRVLRIFLLLPGGDRVEGLKQIERAYDQGSIFAFPAGLILMEIYSTYERRAAEAVRIGERLSREYPENPDVALHLAEVYASPGVENYGRAAEQYASLLEREKARGRASRPAKHRARLGLASMHQQQWRIDEAISVLAGGIEENPAEPLWATPTFLLRRGNYRALLADPRASEDARRVKDEQRWKDYHKAADDQLAWLERRRGSGEAEIYAALVPGNRLAAERRWEEAAAVYDKVRLQHPTDPQVRYRIAWLQFARGDVDRASSGFSTLAAQKSVPGWIKAQALLHLGRAHDLAGRRADAVKAYERVVDEHPKESAAYRARIGLVTPYRRDTAPWLVPGLLPSTELPSTDFA